MDEEQAQYILEELSSKSRDEVLAGPLGGPIAMHDVMIFWQRQNAINAALISAIASNMEGNHARTLNDLKEAVRNSSELTRYMMRALVQGMSNKGLEQ